MFYSLGLQCSILKKELWGHGWSIMVAFIIYLIIDRLITQQSLESIQKWNLVVLGGRSFPSVLTIIILVA